MDKTKLLVELVELHHIFFNLLRTIKQMFVLYFMDVTLSFKHLSLFYHFITSHICLVPSCHDKRSQLLANLIGYLPKYFI